MTSNIDFGICPRCTDLRIASTDLQVGTAALLQVERLVEAVSIRKDGPSEISRTDLKVGTFAKVGTPEAASSGARPNVPTLPTFFLGQEEEIGRENSFPLLDVLSSDISRRSVGSVGSVPPPRFTHLLEVSS